MDTKQYIKVPMLEVQQFVADLLNYGWRSLNPWESRLHYPLHMDQNPYPKVLRQLKGSHR